MHLCVFVCVAMLLTSNIALADAFKLPKHLRWETHDSSPVFADPFAKKGGTFQSYLYSFPTTFRTFGLGSNNQGSELLLANQLQLLTLHPNSAAYLPSLATHWAVDTPKHRVFYKLSQVARWSDKTPLTADDYLFAHKLMQSPYIFSGKYTELSKNIQSIQKHTSHIISITAKKPHSKSSLLALTNIRPQPKHFYRISKDWLKTYNYQISPNTGPYVLSEFEKGKYLKFSRKTHWWAKDLKYFQNTYNIDHLVYTVIRDPSQIWQEFLKGNIHSHSLMDSQMWHQKYPSPAFENGHIQKLWLYIQAPDGGSLIFLNQKRPLWQNRDIRIAFAHALHFERVIEHIFRGEYKRLQAFYSGYGKYTNVDIKARTFDPSKAKNLLKAAGYSLGNHGFWQKRGQRFSVELLYAYSSITPWLTVLREEARKIGVEIQLKLTSPSTYAKRIQNKDYDAVVTAQYHSRMSPPKYWSYFHGSKRDHPDNLTASHHPKMNTLLDRYKQEIHESTKQQLSQELLRLIHEEAAFIPGFSVPYTRVGLWREWKLPRPIGTKLYGFSSATGHHMIPLMYYDPTDTQAKKSPNTIIDTTFKTP